MNLNLDFFLNNNNNNNTHFLKRIIEKFLTNNIILGQINDFLIKCNITNDLEVANIGYFVYLYNLNFPKIKQKEAFVCI
jgi:hypothetical protein